MTQLLHASLCNLDLICSYRQKWQPATKFFSDMRFSTINSSPHCFIAAKTLMEVFEFFGCQWIAKVHI